MAVEDYHGKRVQALTLKANGRPRDIVSHVRINAIQGTSTGDQDVIEGKAIWDTGASGSVISSRAASTLGLQPVGRVKMRGAHTEQFSNRYFVDVLILQSVGITRLQVAEAELGDDLIFLIGMDIMSLGDLALTRGPDNTLFTFRVPSIEKPLDFGEEIESYNSAIRQAHKSSPNLRNEIAKKRQSRSRKKRKR